MTLSPPTLLIRLGVGGKLRQACSAITRASAPPLMEPTLRLAILICSLVILLPFLICSGCKRSSEDDVQPPPAPAAKQVPPSTSDPSTPPTADSDQLLVVPLGVCVTLSDDGSCDLTVVCERGAGGDADGYVAFGEPVSGARHLSAHGECFAQVDQAEPDVSQARELLNQVEDLDMDRPPEGAAFLTYAKGMAQRLHAQGATGVKLWWDLDGVPLRLSGRPVSGQKALKPKGSGQFTDLVEANVTMYEEARLVLDGGALSAAPEDERSAASAAKNVLFSFDPLGEDADQIPAGAPKTISFPADGSPSQWYAVDFTVETDVPVPESGVLSLVAHGVGAFTTVRVWVGDEEVCDYKSSSEHEDVVDLATVELSAAEKRAEAIHVKLKVGHTSPLIEMGIQSFIVYDRTADAPLIPPAFIAPMGRHYDPECDTGFDLEDTLVVAVRCPSPEDWAGMRRTDEPEDSRREAMLRLLSDPRLVGDGLYVEAAWRPNVMGFSGWTVAADGSPTCGPEEDCLRVYMEHGDLSRQDLEEEFGPCDSDVTITDEDGGNPWRRIAYGDVMVFYDAGDELVGVAYAVPMGAEADDTPEN